MLMNVTRRAAEPVPELYSGLHSFQRSFTLPSTVDAERIQATVDHGVLTIRLPKSEKSKPREIPVRAGR